MIFKRPCGRSNLHGCYSSREFHAVVLVVIIQWAADRFATRADAGFEINEERLTPRGITLVNRPL